jgi:hypothetical protein
MTSTTSESRCFITLSLDTWTVRFARAALSVRLKIFLSRRRRTSPAKPSPAKHLRLTNQTQSAGSQHRPVNAEKIIQPRSVDPGSDAS